ncbi:SGNH/GDSL hydrolase family protein [uncultured Draconibacterium sp.]|uniref:SGNH/GDSL hydrolase family protein n=1 Tax=uncultured Draconibacterium sp. TaxID=1573823 RepID=UPI0029C7BCA8|nr:SGNH/GDSL hydrolase family protein [uncultured Draconibacterium sp.]
MTQMKLCLRNSTVLIFIFCLWSFAPPNKQVNILCLGDSITQGGKRDRQEYTYRLPLQIILQKEKVNFDFIGSRKMGLHEDATWPEIATNVAFDPDHEGYYGNKTADACRKAIEAYDSYNRPPDFILVHLGTNDQNSENFEKIVGQPLREMICFFREKNPNVIVLMGHLNFNDSEAAFEIRNVVEDLAEELDTKRSPVITVHHYQGWHENPKDIYADTFDWAHPNLKGQEKMAINWWINMKKFLPLKEN